MAISVLLVDDDPNILETAADVLEDAGFLITKADSAASAKEQIGRKSVDLAILDYSLPDTQGNQLAFELRRLCPKLKVILLTGQQSHDIPPCEASVNRVLTKPVDPPQLVRIINELLDQ